MKTSTKIGIVFILLGAFLIFLTIKSESKYDTSYTAKVQYLSKREPEYRYKASKIRYYIGVKNITRNTYHAIEVSYYDWDSFQLNKIAYYTLYESHFSNDSTFYKLLRENIGKLYCSWVLCLFIGLMCVIPYSDWD